jgi:prophage regulatory protein
MKDIDRLIRMRELIKIVSMSRSNIYVLMNKGLFPKSFKIGEQTAVWRLSAIEEWIKQKENE